MKYNIRKNWISASDTLLKKPVILTPFIIIGFLECLVLEVAYFSVRFPLSKVFAPVIKKFFGEAYLHYPASLAMLPKLFYYGQTLVYVFISVFLVASAIQIYVNIRTGHPVILKAILKSTAKRYLSFAGYGLIYVVLMHISERGEGFLSFKGLGYISRHFFKISSETYSIITANALFFTFVVVQSFIALTLPIIIIEKKSLFKAIIGSVAVSARNFIKIFCLIVVPFLLYMPMILMNAFLLDIMDKTFPEVSFYITLLNIIITVVIDCFIMVSVTQFLLDIKKAR